MGPKAFEQAAGFLRIRDAKNPLDGSAVHPEAYALVERMAAATGRPLKAIIGDRDFLRKIKPAEFADADFGVPTIVDIVAELEKPGRDPRPEFKTAEFQDGVETLNDLKPGMRLEGVVTNVTNFGAFVDIGVHQDGLVHISELSDKFVKDPHEVVKAGDIVQVRVKEVDVARKRIALTMKSGAIDTSAARQPSPAPGPRGGQARPSPQSSPQPSQGKGAADSGESALAAALRRAQERR